MQLVKVSDPDHLPAPGKALHQKSPDWFTVPLCRKHHELRGLKVRRPYSPAWMWFHHESLPADFDAIDLWCAATTLLWHYHHPPAGNEATPF
jgi:hypothetical protein